MEKSKIAIAVEEETKNIHKLAEKLEDAIKHEFEKGIKNEEVNTKEIGEVIDMLKDLYEAKEKIVKACYYKQVMEAMEEADFEDEEDIMDYGRRYYNRNRYANGRFAPKGRGTRRGYDEPPYYHMTPDMYRNMSMEEMRDMDREMGRMYYSGGGSTGGSRGGQNSGGMSGNSGSGSNSGGSYSGGNSSMGYEEPMRGYSDGRSGRDGRSGNYNESRSERARRNYTETKEMHKDDSIESKQEKMKSLEEYMKEMGSDLSELVMEMNPSEKELVKKKLSMLVQKIQ